MAREAATGYGETRWVRLWGQGPCWGVPRAAQDSRDASLVGLLAHSPGQVLPLAGQHHPQCRGCHCEGIWDSSAQGPEKGRMAGPAPPHGEKDLDPRGGQPVGKSNAYCGLRICLGAARP